MFVRSCFVLLLVLGVATAAKKKDGKFFKFEDCSKKGAAIAEVPKFEITPDPVSLDKNMTVNSVVTILRDVPEGALLRTRYYKMKSLFGVDFDVPIPCFLGMFGSCTLPFCQYLKLFKDQVEPVWPEDKPYGCPVNAGEYGGENVEIPIPDISMIGRFIVRGRYRSELRLVDTKQNGKEIACFKIWTEIK